MPSVKFSWNGGVCTSICVDTRVVQLRKAAPSESSSQNYVHVFGVPWKGDRVSANLLSTQLPRTC